MVERHALKRTRSPKNLPAARKNRKIEQDEPIPYRAIEQQFVQFHITSDGIQVGRTSQVPVIPERKSSQRKTWPVTSPERRAGSYNFDSTPHLTPTPWEDRRSTGRTRPHRRPRRESKPLPRQIFEQLPREIYHCILEQHATLYTRCTEVDVVGLQTDFKSLLLVNKRWCRLAREHLYREIWLPSNDELPRRAFTFRSRTRLKLLLRALRDNNSFAPMVRDLRVTADLALALDSPNTRKAAYDIVVDIIKICPKLESFSGYQPSLKDDVSAKLIEALAGRQGLRACAWNMRDTQLGSGKLTGFTTMDFLEAHNDWDHLETLCICSAENLVLGPGMISGALRRLPSLKRLMLADLNRHDFHNGTLLDLPALRSLRLEHVTGITGQGLEHFSRGSASSSLERLSLVGLELTSLRVIQTLLTNLSRLKNFTFVQDTAPEPHPAIEAPTNPGDFASRSLQYLHWDVLPPSTATSLIAHSIAAGTLPSLTKIKIPCDYTGSIQALCRPIAQDPLNPTDLELLSRFNTSVDHHERFLRLSQIQAQLRIHESRAQPSFNVVVEDEDRRVSETHVIGSYLGSMESRIEYCLEPDVEGSHYALVDFGDVEAPKWLYEMRNEMERSVKGEQILDLRSLF
ncbi:hypothetical protein Tdes44962_MAKER01401 [Teratosphaeria destructans]|uniref:F-box domain-containing protein n=1 Tax=Teratosphaeria destructans TaxID=418781 RepID=A0A9W7T0N0_9PEZI|nr:hypothetical protein Tdes44962_MAKER01401 [Teratosphaeria destructans]